MLVIVFLLQELEAANEKLINSEVCISRFQYFHTCSILDKNSEFQLCDKVDFFSTAYVYNTQSRSLMLTSINYLDQ